MKHLSYTILISCLLVALSGNSQERTIGLVNHDFAVDDGYYLFSPKSSTNSYLINQCGELVRTWTSDYAPGNIEYLSPEGYFVKAGLVNQTQPLGAGGKGGVMEIKDFDDNLLWQYFITDSIQLAHHEFRILENGNILILAWDLRTKEEAIQAGRDTTLEGLDVMWSEKVFEIRPIFPDSAEIVWEWYLWDHLIQDFDSTKDNFGVVADHPELFDINYTSVVNPDWIHANALDYDPVTDQIIMGSRDSHEFYVVDHSTSTAEAATGSGGRWGKGGDILLRWGNPANYDQGDTSDQELYAPHGFNFIDPEFSDRSDILIFNNGRNRPGGDLFTELFQLVPSRDVDSNYVIVNGQFSMDTVKTVYKTDPPTDFYAPFLSGLQRIANDRFMITHGPRGEFFEIDANQNIIWEYVIPIDDNGDPHEQGFIFEQNGNGALSNFTFRATKYSPDFVGFDGIDLTPDGFIEITTLKSPCDTTADTSTGIELVLFEQQVDIYPNPVVAGSNLQIKTKSSLNISNITLVDLQGRAINGIRVEPLSEIQNLQIPNQLSAGMYALRFEFKPSAQQQPIYIKLMLY